MTAVVPPSEEPAKEPASEPANGAPPLVTGPAPGLVDGAPRAWLARAVLGAALAAAAAGALEAMGAALSIRYPTWIARVALTAVVAYGAWGAVLGIGAAFTALAARRLSGNPALLVLAPILGVGSAILLYTRTTAAGTTVTVALALAVAAAVARAGILPRPLAHLARASVWAGLVAAALGAVLLCVAARGVPAAGVAGALSILAGLAGLAPRRRAAAASWSGLALALGATLFLLDHRPGASAPRPDPDRPNVVLVTFDTLRADHVGCYGYERLQTPAFDRIAAEGVLFQNASAQAPVTGPSHTTILTGLFPPDHGVISNGIHPSHRARALSDHLAASGWETAAFVSGFTLSDRSAGLAQRFDWYDDDFFAWRPLSGASTRLRIVRELVRRAEARGRSPERGTRPAGEVVDAAVAWLDRRDEERPFFLWAHFFDPHAPYDPPAPFDPRAADPAGYDEETDWYDLSTQERRALVTDAARVERMIALYDGEIAYADSELARLRAELEERGLFDDTVVVVTSDHGEGFGEHDYWFDHVYLYETELRVPLALRAPGGLPADTQVEATVRHVDVMPTVLELVGLPVPEDLGGRSLVSLIGGRADEDPGPALGFGRIEGDFGGYELDGALTSVRRGRYKLLATSEWWLDSERMPAREELYDVVADPEEQRDLLADPAATMPVELEPLRTALDVWRARAAGVSAERDLDEATLLELRRLGYL